MEYVMFQKTFKILFQMVISTSLLMCIKGALFLSKSAALKGALVKIGTYTIAHAGTTSLTATAVSLASTGALACTAAGYYVTVRNMSKRAMEGSQSVIEGLAQGNYTQFCDGLYQLGRAGMSASSVLSTLNDFVDGMDTPPEVRISLKKTIKSLEYQVYDTIEKKSLPLLREVELTLKSKGFSEEKYIKEINEIYFSHTHDLQDDYSELLGRGGRIYSDICSLNNKCGIRIGNEFDYYLAYCIGGWFVEHKNNFSCISGKTQRQVAEDITNHIISYLQAYGLD